MRNVWFLVRLQLQLRWYCSRSTRKCRPSAVSTEAAATRRGRRPTAPAAARPFPSTFFHSSPVTSTSTRRGTQWHAARITTHRLIHRCSSGIGIMMSIIIVFMITLYLYGPYDYFNHYTAHGAAGRQAGRLHASGWGLGCLPHGFHQKEKEAPY